MTISVRRSFFSFGSVALTAGLFLVLFVGSTQQTSAASLGIVSDTISTSRPSASAPLSANQAANANSVTVLDNGSFYLASDSAFFRADTGESTNTVNVASMSASSGTPATRTLYFTSSVTNAHHTGDPVVTSLAATHLVKFTASTAVPTSGKIVIILPALASGDSNNTASPSASTFQLNGLSDTNVKINGLSGAATFTGTYTNPTSGTSPIISLALTGTTTIAAGASITIGIGCTTVSATACSAAVPTLINPTKTAAAGTADTWNMTVRTTDSGNIELDSAKIRIATVESVQVQATVDPTLTVTIAGLGAAADFNSSSGSCTSETANAGLATTATFVNLGVLSSAVINKAGQTITVSTNASQGYTITATSSGTLINASSGYYLQDANGAGGLTANDTPAPAIMAAGTEAFGIFPCGAAVTASSPNWVGGSAIGSGGKGSNPWNVAGNGYYATIARRSSAVSSQVTVIRYAATISATTPAGIYSNVYTYVITPTF